MIVAWGHLYDCRKIQDSTCCASRDIWVSFWQLLVIFTMALELSREQLCTMILYDEKIGLNDRERHACLVAAWRNQAPSNPTVLNWFYEYEHGKLDVSDSSTSAPSRTAATNEMINAVRLMIAQWFTCDISINRIFPGVKSTAIYSILHDHLKL